MKVILFSIFFVIGTFSCLQEANLPNETDAQEVLNYYLSRTVSPCLCNGYPLANQELDELAIGPEDSIALSTEGEFSGDEITHLIKQLKPSNSVVLDSKMIRSRRIIPIDSVRSMLNKKTLWNYLRKEYNSDGFSTISYPIFSKDKSKAIIKVESYSESGSAGALYLMEKKTGKWALKEQLLMWED